jgi:hypothetical protein
MRQPVRRQPAVVPAVRPSFGGFLVQRRAGLGALAVVVAAVIGGSVAWTRFGHQVRERDGYTLTADGVRLVGQAAWVKADIAAEALRDASLDGNLPLDDPELARRLARAFDVHPWVRSVERVEVSHPPQATVEIHCREPVAMVRVTGGLLPVDDEAVVLPSGDFTPEEAATYPVLSGIDSLPQGPAGAAWGDPAVEEGVALVTLVRPEWNSLSLTECRRRMEGGGWLWELVNAEGVTIIFGGSPGREPPGEAGAAEKIAALKSLAADGPMHEACDLRRGQLRPASQDSGGVTPITQPVDTAPSSSDQPGATGS